MVYLSGRHSSDGQQFGKYSQDDVDALRAIAEEPGVVDLFLTYPCVVMDIFYYLFCIKCFMLLARFIYCCVGHFVP